MSNCLLCNESDYKTIYDGITSSYSRDLAYSVCECVGCGLIQTIPRPTTIELSQFYSNKYAYDLHEANYPEKLFRAKKLVRRFGEPIGGSVVLEIGCGSGALLKYLQDKGSQVFGCELDELSAARANLVLGSEQVKSINASEYLKHIEIIPDFIYLSHVLEHFEDPIEILTNIRSISRENTSIIIAVPNVSNVRHALFPKKWGYWQVPIHITHFSRESLQAMMLSVGFKEKERGYCNSDFLTFGSHLLNLINGNNNMAPRGKFFKWIITTLSLLHCSTYYLGRNDLLAVYEIV